MEKPKCPKCQTAIEKTWPNPINKKITIGHCKKCRRFVKVSDDNGSPDRNRKAETDTEIQKK